MGEEYRGKVVRSGNSVALRLPKALGVTEGTEMRIVCEEANAFRVEPVDAPKRKFNIDKVWGIARGSGLQLIRSEDRVFAPRRLIWDEPEREPHSEPGQ